VVEVIKPIKKQPISCGKIKSGIKVSGIFKAILIATPGKVHMMIWIIVSIFEGCCIGSVSKITNSIVPVEGKISRLLDCKYQVFRTYSNTQDE
jgi:hypothetical protein